MRTVLRWWWSPLLAAAVAALLLTGTFLAQEGSRDGYGVAGRKPAPEGRGKHKAQDKEIRAALREVINRGADLFNPPNNDAAGCARMYQGALITVRPLLKGHGTLQTAIDQALAEADALPGSAKRAFALRAVLDQIRAELAPSKATGKGGEKKGSDKKTEEKKGGDKKVEEKKTTLWQRLGGEANVRRVVDDFVTTAAADPKVDFTRGGKYKVDVTKLEKGLVEFVSQHTGGPLKYTGPNMKEVHKGMHITDAQFDRAADLLRRALEKNGAKAADARAVLNLVGTTRHDIVEPAEVKKPVEKKVEKGPVEKKTEEKKGADSKAPAAGDASVSGRVTYKGKPLPGGSVSFVRADGKTFQAPIAADGAYQVKGPIPAGTYKVAIVTAAVKPAANGPGRLPADAKQVGPPKGSQPGTAPTFLSIPARYARAETSGLTVSLRKGNNVFDIDLQ